MIARTDGAASPHFQTWDLAFTREGDGWEAVA
jgi:hypothetical protein